MLNYKRFTYSALKNCLIIKDGNMVIMIGQLNTHNLYCVNTSSSILVTILSTCIITAAISLSATNLTIWHCQFAYYNSIYLKQLSDITSGMKIFAGAKDLFTYTMCV